MDPMSIPAKFEVIGYYDGVIGSHIRAFDWYQNQRPWMTLNDVSRDCPKFLSTHYYLRNG